MNNRMSSIITWRILILLKRVEIMISSISSPKLTMTVPSVSPAPTKLTTWAGYATHVPMMLT